MKIKIQQTSYLAITLVALLFGCSSSKDQKSQIGKDKPIALTKIDEDSLDIKIGQMIIVGLNENQIDSASGIIKDVKASKIGGVVLYEKNISKTNSAENLKNLVSSLQNAANIPLFIGIDEEGGYVHRLKEKYGFPKTVSAAYLGKIDHLDTTRMHSAIIASTLKQLGINLNFAPVVDLAINENNPIIAKKERSFSKKVKIVTKHAQEFIKVHHEFGIKTVLKHFPGHGSSTTDSHLNMTDVTKTWKKRELKPYRSLIKSGNVDAVMTAHIINFKLDTLPATLSKKIITGVLREDLKFNGVIFSDDMQMRAISDFYGFEKSIKSTIISGVDVIMFSNNISGVQSRTSEIVHQTIKKAVLEGEIPISRINESFNRIMKMKNGFK